MYKKFLPSKIVIAIFIIPILSIMLFFLLIDNVSIPIVKKGNAKNNLKIALEEELTKKDGDEDGLLDWEERLYETDINNPDSDGDGILDGLEVRTGTNPMDPFNKESRKNEIEKIVSGKSEYNYRSDSNLTQTDKFSRDLFVKIAELKGSNLIDNISAQNKIIEEVLEKNIKDYVPIEVKIFYTQKDLKISNNLSIEDFRKVFGNVNKKYEWEKVEDDIYLLVKFSENDDVKVFDKINNNIILYEKYKKDLLEMGTPEIVYAPVLQYINSLHEYSFILKKIISLKEDPIGLINHIQSLQISSDKMEWYSKAISSIFNNNSI